MNAVMTLVIQSLHDLSDADFKVKLQSQRLFSEVEALLPLIPEELKREIRALTFQEVKKAIQEHASRKASIITAEGKWPYLEKTFNDLKKKL